MKKRYAVILAAGQGTRMKSGKHKVLHPVCGKPIIDHILDALDQIGVDETIVVVGHRAEQVRSHVESGPVSWSKRSYWGRPMR